MARAVTLFTGQWADLSFEQICAKAKSFGYDGVELACWGDHFDVDQCLKDKGYAKGRWQVLQDHGLQAFAISSHLVGQAVCDLIDERHKLIGLFWLKQSATVGSSESENLPHKTTNSSATCA